MPENLWANRELRLRKEGESGGWRTGLGRCETGANPLKTMGNRKPAVSEKFAGETVCLFSNGGGGGIRTRVRRCGPDSIYTLSLCFGFSLRS